MKNLKDKILFESMGDITPAEWIKIRPEDNTPDFRRRFRLGEFVIEEDFSKPDIDTIIHILKIDYSQGSVSDDYDYTKRAKWILKQWDLTDREIRKRQYKK